MEGTPIIPETITVHLGTPDSSAENVTLSFPDYIKNVVSSEIFPTWPENALRANIYAAVTFALNRIYTEWYRSRGYDFDITNSTQFDQAFVRGRETFEVIDRLVDELFNDYIQRQGSVEPLFAAFCNGTTVTCEGLSQWGTVGLAEQGFTPYEILQYYYGDDINIVKDAPVAAVTPSFGGITLEEGSTGNDVRTTQLRLNRIGQSYPAIPRIPDADGIYDVPTTDAVREFQSVFGLSQTGDVNEATWYQIEYIFNSLKRLAELNSEGLRLEDVRQQFVEELRPGMQNTEVRILQYYLAVIGAYYAAVTPVEITGFYGEDTTASVRSFQKVFGLPVTGTVDCATWIALFEAYAGIVDSLPQSTDIVSLYPGLTFKEGMSSEYIRILQEYLTLIHTAYPNIPAVSATGYFGPLTRASVTAFQREFGLPEAGIVGPLTWNEIARVYSEVRFGYDKRPYQHPGYTIR